MAHHRRYPQRVYNRYTLATRLLYDRQRQLRQLFTHAIVLPNCVLVSEHLLQMLQANAIIPEQMGGDGGWPVGTPIKVSYYLPMPSGRDTSRTRHRQKWRERVRLRQTSPACQS